MYSTRAQESRNKNIEYALHFIALGLLTNNNHVWKMKSQTAFTHTDTQSSGNKTIVYARVFPKLA